ncbi:Kelch repeats protein [Aspergillus ochraceoroseus]|uniref:Kelch repeats protein n=1 Tax=Aspergillus ochraceoroseus TaxID=138278 RepID=A0A0F8UZH3_9EURO|nr:Kelch repeats protein [Aspergillus ochraceoroseus]
MGKKSKKSAEHKERVAAKQSKKAAQKDKKTKTKGRDADSDAEDADLDAILAQYAEEQAKFLKVTEVVGEPPSPRSSATVLASPSNRNEVLIFGGEYFDGTLATFFNNLFVYLIDRGEWREVTSPNSPLPRSGHAWCRGGNTGGIYLFGGEFSSPKQGTFYHYNDFWHLDPSTREWSRLETKGKGPPARSGHRMTYFKKNYIILFGGFQDTSQQTKYLQDLWIYDCSKYAWFNPVLSTASQKPDPRSSFSLLPHESGAVLYGGYSRVKASTGVGGKPGKGGPQRMTMKPMVHQDTWFLRITPPAADAPASAPPTIRWERRKKPANSPNPPRAGATMAYHKGRGIMFGGVHDVELSEEGIDSEFFDTLFAWNTDRNRFFPLTLRRPKAAGKKQQANQGKSRDRTKADEEELLQNLKALEAKGGLRNLDDGDDDEFMQNAPKTNEEPEQPEKPAVVRFEMPHMRFNAQLAVQEDTLFIYGGTFEKGDREFTFNDMYSIDLVKMNGVKEVFSKEPDNWHLLNEADSDDEMEEDEEEGDEDDEEDEEDAMSLDTASPAPTEITVPSVTLEMEQLDVEEQGAESSVQDSRPLPRPFESLREFFSRTSEEWQKILIDTMKEKGMGAEKNVKELRKDAFEMAEEKWWDSREEITALEDEQEAAGIGEVVSIADRENAGGAGRRR